MANLYGERAAHALDLIFPGRHKNKRVARAFGISVRLAKYLRAGKRWHSERLAQAVELFGDAWEAAMSRRDSDFSYELEKQDFERRLAKLEQYLGEMDREMARAMAPDQAAARNVARGGHSPDEPMAPHAGTNGGNEKAGR